MLHISFSKLVTLLDQYFMLNIKFESWCVFSIIQVCVLGGG